MKRSCQGYVFWKITNKQNNNNKKTIKFAPAGLLKVNTRVKLISLQGKEINISIKCS